MRPFVITDIERAQIAAVKTYGEAHVLSMHDILEATGNPDRSFALDEKRRVRFPFGFLAVYTLEQQPIGLCHHLSLRVLVPGRYPHPTAMQMLAAEFGWKICLEPPSDNLVNAWLDDYCAAHIIVQDQPASERAPAGAAPAAAEPAPQSKTQDLSPGHS